MKLLSSLTKQEIEIRESDSPFKRIEKENNSEVSSKTSLRENISYEPRRSSKRIFHRIERPTRDIYKYDY